MKLDELYSHLCSMIRDGIDPERLREELECAIKSARKDENAPTNRSTEEIG